MKMENFQNINHFTNHWARGKGIHSIDLEKHPQADDVVLLINFKDEFRHKFIKTEQAQFNGIWGMVYAKQFPLKEKHLRQLEKIINDITYRQDKMAKIRTLRKTQSS
jgi:hypothetical protein